MPWTAKSPPKVAKNWSPAAKALCARVANAVLKQSGKDDQAIYACIRAVKLKYPNQIGSTKKNEDMPPIAKAYDFFAEAYDISGIKFEEEGEEGESQRHVTKGMTLAVGGKFVHPFWGEIDLSDQVLNEMKRNHDKKVLGTDVAIDERHDRGRAKGWIKPGSLKRTKVKYQGKEYPVLLGDIAWTSEGRALLEEKIYKYFSPEFGTYTEPDGKTEHKNVLTGGALTNRPFLKMIPSIKFEKDKEVRTVFTLDEGTEDDELWEQYYGTGVPAFSVKFTAFNDDDPEGDEDDVPLAELLAKAKSLGIDVADENALATALESMVTVAKSDEATRAKLKEAGIQFDDKTPTADVVVATLGTFSTQMKGLTEAISAMNEKSLETEASNAARALLAENKILPVQLEEYTKLYQKDKTLFTSLTAKMPKLVQFGEIGGPGALVGPGEDNETDMREFQDPTKAEAKALEYLEKTSGLTPKSKQQPTRFEPGNWKNGRYAGARS